VLHTLLERPSAKIFVDLAIDIPLDVSNYLFFATCNKVDLVPHSLRSRFREFTITVTKDQLKRMTISITRELLDELPGADIAFEPRTIDALSEIESPRLIRSHAFDALGRALVGKKDMVEPSHVKAKAPTSRKVGFFD
jgi:AAA+ superfamily predicted ATPase